MSRSEEEKAPLGNWWWGPVVGQETGAVLGKQGLAHI